MAGMWPPAGTALTDTHIAAGGWSLVRAVAPGNKWHPARDQLRGTDAYEQPDGITFSRRYEHEEFDEFLFVTTDLQCWLWCTRHAAIGDYYDNAPREVLASSLIPSRHVRKWYHRRGCAEDPWISLKDHWDDDRTTQLYGEASFGQQHVTLLRQHGGARVYIRSAAAAAAAVATEAAWGPAVVTGTLVDGATKTLAEMVAGFKEQLGLAGTINEVVNEAAHQLGVEANGRPLIDVAKECSTILGL